MTERLVVIGGDATGMSAASQARRRRSADELEIVAFERGRHTSYSACGIPYWIGGDTTGDALIARTPDEHRAHDIDVRLATEAIEVDPAAGRVRTRDADGREEWTGYDHLVIATGAVPVRPSIPGIDADGVHGVQTLDDGEAVLHGLGGAGVRRAVVVGGGYIGVEMAEALLRHGLDVTLVDRAEQPMTTLDPDMGRLVRVALEGLGVRVVSGVTVSAVLTGDDGRVRAVATDEDEYPADIVVLGIGVRPGTELARAAGLPLGAHGGLLTDRAMRVPGTERIWAGGDCVEVLNLVSGALQHIALGTHANKHGRIIGTNIGGGYATFPGVVGTAVSKVCDVELARTGLLEAQARAAGLEFVTAVIESTTRAGYYPDAATMTVKMLAERGTGRLLGVQIIGREGAAKRVDIAAVALTAGMTVGQMVDLDLGYAPPFSPVWDPVLVAARKAADAVAADIRKS
ncbi:NADPH-dependent 2,4-dienoyl-CoA reductase, sulfur reductase [Streptomyces sp. DvalAA-14]|uniref:FAD-dependent oxidoreductase n=1 Tax=unclassified Streptomyces TaxID=2593676 RepID=UPI00081B7605|nr:MULTISPECIES: FAD-dependent oxidoreductase [unclassified Streptomyces]MYS23102.1 FAD-dependent oxidoreductase [Streptomyces sp. SID4948]SCE27479.1 NADPH-dependent 2,4-dienoyl-CoA reductase, sulfur reductase [Streptomyces sp. DvalAA-14]